jgi:hypothetical protein
LVTWRTNKTAPKLSVPQRWPVASTGADMAAGRKKTRQTQEKHVDHETTHWHCFTFKDGGNPKANKTPRQKKENENTIANTIAA